MKSFLTMLLAYALVGLASFFMVYGVIMFAMEQATAPSQPAQYEQIADTPHGGVDRVMDNEASVVCYLYQAGGISCLPMYVEETDPTQVDARRVSRDRPRRL